MFSADLGSFNSKDLHSRGWHWMRSVRGNSAAARTIVVVAISVESGPPLARGTCYFNFSYLTLFNLASNAQGYL